ncbi:hypothetical protein ACEWY4_016518 [Coilia grayii]|uniref:Mitochondrial ribosomal protein S36 n=1 Tax=Coilia grayii TaxID=363190 RepID=A0ABD1JMY6_9TELE
MAATGRLVVKAVRPHAPMIKFPNRRLTPRPNVEEMLKSAVNISVAPNSPITSTTRSTQSQIPSVHPLSGPPDSVASVRALPAKYRRRMLVVEEMEYIQRGGPE